MGQDTILAPVEVGEFGHATKHTEERDQINYLTGRLAGVDNPYLMRGRLLRHVSDSFGTAVDGIMPWPSRVAADLDMVLDNTARGGSYWRDCAVREIGQYTPMPTVASGDDFVSLASGINPARVAGDNALVRAAERDALEALIWLAATAQRIEQAAFTYTGAWADADNVRVSGGSMKYAGTNGAYAEITPGAGDYVAIGYSLKAGVGPVSSAGQWAVAGNNVNTPDASAPDATYLANAADAAENLVPRPVRLLGVGAGQTVRVTKVAGADYVYVDVLLKLAATPRWVIVVKPTYTKTTGTFTVPKATIDKYRADVDTVVASVAAAYKPLRGKIVVVDPVASGWDPEVHCGPDALHPSEAGQRFLRDLVERKVGFAANLRPQLLAAGAL